MGIMIKEKNIFKKGDKVKLSGCPFDEQILGELERYIDLKDKTQVVTKITIPRELGTSGQWVETNLMDGKWDKVWFKKI